jgi:gentisate 1,2-dioxygenase
MREWLAKTGAMKHYNPEAHLPDGLVTHSSEAEWIGEEITGNPSRIGVLLGIPTRSIEFYLQEIPSGGSSDLQRHPHESIHYVIEGSGYSEIGPERVDWATGDFIYTPVWVWHRHYNTGAGTVRMLLIENSRLLEHLGLNQRESMGLVSYKEYRQKHSAQDES